MNMRIELKLRASLKRFTKSPDGVCEMELEEGSTVGTIADSLKIPNNDLGIILVNKVSADTSVVLKDGDKVEFFTMMKGG